jgi:arylsulfatase A-like enzyme
MRNAGYFTGLFGKFLNAWSDFRNVDDFDRWSVFDGGYFGFRVNEQGTVKPISQYSTDYVRDRALGFLQESETNDSQPWFLMVTPVAPHLPAIAEPDYENVEIPDFVPNPATWEADRTDKPPWVQYSVSTPEGQALVLQNRESQLRTLPSVDDMVEALLNQLQASGETNTLAVFMSDNGYMWGEHNLDAKPRPYLDSVRVPMYMRWPGQVPAGATDNRLVANVDLAPTISAATGVSLGGQTDGRNLLDASWSRDRLLTEMAYQGNVPAWAALVTPTSHYIESYRPADPSSISFREYYDLTNDPYELDNLLSDANTANDPNVASLSAQLAEDRVCAGTNCP